ncbi:MAG TPA: DMT family transporter [Steroidobacteraceae bacterium]|nr:DMT family transporter [Steroidobacteraceae bacterium]
MSTATTAQATERLRGISAMVAAVFVFAIMDASLKHLSAQYGMFQVAFLRCVASLAFLCATISWRRGWSGLAPRSPALHLFRGLLGIATLASFVFAVHSLSLAETYALFLCAPLLMTALSVPIHGEHVPPRRWLAIAAGLCGVLLVLQPTGRPAAPLAAVAAAALSAACYAISALTVRTLGRTNSSTSMVFWSLLVGAIGCGLLARGDWRPVPAHDLGWLALIGLCGALGQYWLTDAFRRAPPSVVGPFEYTSILWAFAIDWIFWSAIPSPGLLVGAAVVIASGIFVIWDERRLALLAMSPASPPP